jgi:hypothetical protein
VAFLLYLPVGLAMVCDFARLEMESCVDLDLGEEYCQGKYLKNTTATADEPTIALTSLWDYSECSGINELRSITQCVCMFMLMGFYGSYALDPAVSSTSSAIGEDGAPRTNSIAKV